jgi:hypothetical protein
VSRLPEILGVVGAFAAAVVGLSFVAWGLATVVSLLS